MKIEKLTDNKIRVTFSIQELEKQNIDYHSFMSNSIENRYIFSALLSQAKEEFNFNTDNARISVDTFELSDGNFIVTITKFSIKKKKVSLRRKLNNLHNNSCIYKFSNIDNFCDFCIFLQTSSPHIIQILENKNSLFKINDEYFFTINNLNFTYTDISILSSYISEFATFINNSNSLISKLIENSKCIIKNNAINTCLSFFVSKK